MIKRRISRLGLILAIGASLIAASATAASAAPAPALKVMAIAPDYVTPGGGVLMTLAVQNVGDAPMDGLLTIRTRFPNGIAPVDWANDLFNVPDPQCQTVGQETECSIDVTGVEPGVQMRVRLDTTADPGASGPLTAGQIEVSGGGTTDTFTEPLSMVAGPAGPFAIKSFDVGMSPSPTGLSPARAGSDPMELKTLVATLSEARSNPLMNLIVPSENFRDVVVHVPPGLVGNPTATPVRCTQSQLAEQAVVNGVRVDIPACPPESQVGLAQLNFSDIVPVYNLEPPPGSPAAFGFKYTVVVTLLAKVRPSDNGIDIVTEKAVSSVPIPKFEVTLWGAPSDPSHDRLRGVCLHGGAGFNASIGDCSLRTRTDVPFLRMPTSCPGTPLLWGIDMDTYQNVGNFVHRETTTSPIEGCQYNPFDPGFSLVPSTHAPHASSGLDAAVTLTQDVSTTGIASADLRKATVTLPDGLTINPSSADGLAACSDAQLRLRQEGPATCPDASKLGTVTLRTQLLDHEIGGSIFLRTQNSDDPLSGELFRIAIELRSDADGIAIRLPGSIRADPTTGRLTTVFDDAPQLPFESMALHFKQGPRAPLASPGKCGTHTTSVDLLSWGDAPRHLETSFTTTGCKPPGFAPKLSGGMANPIAGTQSSFALRLTREDTDQEFSSLNVTTPQGLAAVLKGVPVGSQVGTVTTGAGVGTNPLYITDGKVFLAGPLQGRPALAALLGPGDRRALQPGHGRGQGSRPHRSGNGPDHGQKRPAADDPRRRPTQRPRHPGQHEPTELHGQPDQL